MRSSLLILCTVCLCAVSGFNFKSRAGEPSEFGDFVLPTPSMNAEIEESAAYYVEFTPANGMRVQASQDMYCSSDVLFEISLFSPLENQLTVTLVDPNGNSVNLGPVTSTAVFPLGDDGNGVSGIAYSLENPIIGKYTLSMLSDPLNHESYQHFIDDTDADGYILVSNEDNISAFTSLSTYSLFPGRQIGIITHATEDSINFNDVKSGKIPTPIKTTGMSAEMIVVMPDGTHVHVPMHDDGLSNDGVADDGIFAANIVAPMEGDYIVHANIMGTTSAGVKFERTTEQIVPVIDQLATLQGTAVGIMEDHGNRMIVNILATPKSELIQYRAYAEVWGKDANGNDLAICWIGGMTIAMHSGSDVVIPLELDMNWVSRVNAQEPFTLKNVIIQDPSTFLPYDQADLVPLKVAGNIPAILSSISGLLTPASPYPISEEMRMGRRPAEFQLTLNSTAPAADGATLLIHGYCVEANPWEAVKTQFTNPKVFLSVKANDGNDAFAKKVVAWGGNTPWTYIGHSQGGCAGVHILEFYWSGLDLVSGGRLVQSLGSPFQGTSAAGSAADLGNLFGAGCGKSTDLNRDGAGLWLKTISSDSQGKAYYYTTTANTCNFFTNLILAKQNDGISELTYSHLPSGQNCGNKDGWCHSVGMKYAAQTTDAARNAEMNSKAARSTITQAM